MTGTCVLSAAEFARAAMLLRGGEVVALPTETVYGLAADARNPEAVARVFQVKERPTFDPLITHLPDAGWIGRMARTPERVRGLVGRLAEAFWPGPFTLVLPKSDEVPGIVTAGLPHVALRVSAHPDFGRVLGAVGGPLAAPSANRFGRISPTSARDVLDELGGRIPAVLDGGECGHGIESTIVRPEADGRLTLLRPGPVTVDELSAFGRVVPGEPVMESRPGVPGQMASHYAPESPLVLVRAEDAAVLGGVGRALLAWDERAVALAGPAFSHVEVLAAGGDERLAAARVFRVLRELDGGGFDLVVATRAPASGLGLAINDRLGRAAGRFRKSAADPAVGP